MALKADISHFLYIFETQEGQVSEMMQNKKNVSSNHSVWEQRRDLFQHNHKMPKNVLTF